MRTKQSFTIFGFDTFAGLEQILSLHSAISRDFRSILADRTFKSAFHQHRAYIVQYKDEMCRQMDIHGNHQMTVSVLFCRHRNFQ